MVQRYPTDLTEAEWTIVAPRIPAAKPGGRPRTTDMREVVNAILYSLRSGCQWRMLPKDFPPHQTVSHYFRTWRCAGVWERMHDTLRGDLREASGRTREPSAGIIDSQTVKTTEKGQIPSHYVVEEATAHRKPPEVSICKLRNQSAVGTRPPSTSTPHWPAC